MFVLWFFHPNQFIILLTVNIEIPSLKNTFINRLLFLFVCLLILLFCLPDENRKNKIEEIFLHYSKWTHYAFHYVCSESRIKFKLVPFSWFTSNKFNTLKHKDFLFLARIGMAFTSLCWIFILHHYRDICNKICVCVMLCIIVVLFFCWIGGISFVWISFFNHHLTVNFTEFIP